MVFLHVSGHRFEMRITFEEEGEEAVVGWRQLFESAAERDRVAPYAVAANEQKLDRLEAVVRGSAPPPGCDVTLRGVAPLLFAASVGCGPPAPSGGPPTPVPADTPTAAVSVRRTLRLVVAVPSRTPQVPRSRQLGGPQYREREDGPGLTAKPEGPTESYPLVPVLVEVEVDAEGFVVSARVVRSAAPRAADEDAVAQALTMRVGPDGQPISAP